MTGAAERFDRTRSLIGDVALAALQAAHVCVFGVGGVGGFCVEALARTGIGTLTIVDADKVAPSNMNRQIVALHTTLGRSKVAVMAERIADINPACIVHPEECFFLPDNADDFDFARYDYVVDCVDTVTAKLEIIARAKAAHVPIMSSMGAGNKLDPTRFMVADIEKTSVDPLARVMRRELRKRGISGVKVVYSTEEPSGASAGSPSSIAFVPSVAGLIIAGEVIKDIAGLQTERR